MAFLRNAYLLVNYGDFRDGTTDKDDPYVQLLSTTNPAEAHEDFVQARLHGVDTTGGQRLLNTTDTKTSGDPDSSTNDDDNNGSGIGAWFSKHYVVVAVAGGSAIAALLLLALLCYWLRARKQKRAIRANYGRGGAGGYATLDAPAPEHETLQVAGYNAVVPTLGYGGASPSPSPRPGHRTLLSGTEAARTHRPSSSFSGSQDFSAVARDAGASGHRPMDSLSVDPLYAMPPGYKRDATTPYSHSRGQSNVSLVWSGDGDSEHEDEREYHGHEDDDKTPLNRGYPNPWDAPK